MVRSLGGELGKDKIYGSGLFQYVKSKEKREKTSSTERDERKKRETRLVDVDFVKEPLPLCVCVCVSKGVLVQEYV